MNEPADDAQPELRVVLLVEDNAADVRLTELAFAEVRSEAELRVVRDGVEALRYLRGQAPFQRSPRPDLVLLDLNLPRKGGLEVLRELKEDRALRAIPCVILSSSTGERDVSDAYDRHANAYVAKPRSYEAFVAIVRELNSFWLEANVRVRGTE